MGQPHNAIPGPGADVRHGSSLHDEAMNHITAITKPEARERHPRTWGVLLLVFALAVSACSSDDETSRAATTPDPTPTTAPAPDPTPTAVPPVSETPAVETPPAAAPASDGVDAYVAELEATGFDGVIAVRDGADITIRALGLADRENNVPVDAETVFDVGSLTKQFTAAAILRLEMDGVVSVDDPLGEHVPGLPDDKAAITLHQLLTHTSGLPRDIGTDYEPISRSDFLAAVGETPLLHEPGGEFEYSNVGYAILGAVIEFRTGGPYEAYLHGALFEPAGMLDTGYVIPDWDGHTIAVGYAADSGQRFGRPNEQLWDTDGPYWHLLANGGLLSTAADMLRWDEAIMGDDVLDAAARAKYFAPHIPLGPMDDGGYAYGYGWQVIPTPMGTPLITHNGGNHVFFADLLRFVDQDVTIFLATNSSEDSDFTAAYEVANRVLDGALTPMFEAGGEDTDEDVERAAEQGESVYDAELAQCGFVPVDALPDSAAIDTPPDSPAGRATATFESLLAEGDAAARLAFATDHVTTDFADGDLAVAVAGIEHLQSAYAGYETAAILMQDDLRFHLFMQGPGTDALISLRFDETDPQRLACVILSP